MSNKLIVPTLKIANKPMEIEYPKTNCTLCGKEMNLSSLKRHLRRVHPDFGGPEPVKNPKQLGEAQAYYKETRVEIKPKAPKIDREKMRLECTLCKSTMTRKHLRKHFKRLHPGQEHEYAKVVKTANYIEEEPPSKRKKTVEETQETAVDQDDNSTSSSQCSLKCGCGVTFESKIYFQVHETLFHRSFSTLKRCEHPGCFGLFLSEKLHSLHKEAMHVESG
mmetsp:Transcript_33432/g.58585  ORF Transcript_33432/g.58585 Transcript_33432/m.58585 type:complete len:221 (-) Transcript_33432:19-681(-)